MVATEMKLGEKPRSPRWMKIALIASVALNLGVLGMVAGAALFGPGPHRGFMVREIGFGPFDRALSPEDRDALRKAFQDQMGGRKGDIKAMREDFQGLLGALRAQPFQPDALWALAGQQEQRLTERLKLGQKLLIERIIAMPENERLQFADRLEQEMSRISRRGDDPPPPPEP